MSIEPGGLLAWLVAGAVAGWLVGQLMSGRGFGLLGDVVVGILGAFLGGTVFLILSPRSSTAIVGAIAAAFLGAVIPLVFVRAVRPRTRFGH